MDLEYDRKFDEMKKYIPFLENMINRLESTSTSPKNPRQAQLDKIRSLRDLLLDKKKRMKMENLSKCEQVLINLYAKVEQRDTLPGIKKPSDPSFQSGNESEKKDLDVCRNKLKIVASKINTQKETLPEIARASETEIDCIPGSKEPALFHRRPNKASLSPSRKSLSKDVTSNKSPIKTMSKRNYTRVLISPDASPHRWPESQCTESSSNEKPLFSRRSPRKSPKRRSPSYKKERKKSSKQKKNQYKDLNITLNVPEESLSTLNKRDILSRIIECPDDDVDIKTLCDVKSQILRELKQSGSSEDISDLILKSYKVKKKSKKKEEIEEGELSDSESEAIESIYGSLVIVDKDKNISGQSNRTGANDKSQRKVQICLVLNSNQPTVSQKTANDRPDMDTTDFEMFNDNKTSELCQSSNQEVQKDHPEKQLPKTPEVINIEDDEINKPGKSTTKDTENNSASISTSDNTSLVKSKSLTDSLFRANFYNPINEKSEPDGDAVISKSIDSKFRDLEKENSDNNKNGSENLPSNTKRKSTASDVSSSQLQPPEAVALAQKQNVIEEIPLLNTEPVVPAPPSEKDVLSEIDILQALKNEILSESIAIPGADVSTPLLHQPKVTKVASAQEIMVKKRISIEKYKEQIGPTPKSSLFINDPSWRKTNEHNKKQSLKLTDEELERFKFPPKLALEDSSDEEIEKYSVGDIYDNLNEDLAPKSPDNNDQITSATVAPIIIPVDPIKTSMVSSISDIDMRKIMPILSPNAPKPVRAPSPTSLQILNNATASLGNETKQEPKRSMLMDPRVKRDLSKSECIDNSNPYNTTKERISKPHITNVAPSMTPNSRSFEMTPSRQSLELTPSRQAFEMTPSRQAFEMTPSRQSYDFDDNKSREHVYAPLLSFEPQREQSTYREDREIRWEPNSEYDLWKDTELRDRASLNKWDDHDRGSKGWNRNDRYSHDLRDDYSYRKSDCPRTPVPSFGRMDCPTPPVNPYGRSDCPTTPSHPFGRSECPSTPIHHFGRPDCSPTPSHNPSRSECPMTPNHPFGRSDGSRTPSHPFGRSEMPMTPNHPFGRAEVPFGRSDCPSTPVHSFGRSDCPTTPSHPFGRSDCPTTPSHPFGRSDCPTTPSHPFGRSDMPMTQSHPIGRHDTSRNYPLGQSDYTQNSNRKDPRLNRNSEYGEDRDRGFQRDQRKSEYPHRNYNKAEAYRNYDKEYNRERNDSNSYERKVQRDHRERTPSRDLIVGRDTKKNYEAETLYTRDQVKGRSSNYQHDYENKINYNAQDQKRDYRRAASVGRSGPKDDRFQRAPSIGRNFQKFGNTNTMSVKPDSGRSFTIDTSVNTTFQEFLSGKGLQVLEQSSDMRRTRAASVGRSLARESSVGRTQYRESSVGRSLQTQNTPRVALEDTSGYKRMVNFVRARSMGRDLIDERTLKDVKEDFKSYNSNTIPLKPFQYSKHEKTVNRDPRNKKDMQQSKSSHPSVNPKQVYSPRKNYRDPRVRRDQHDGNNKNRHEYKSKTYGIVYSSDNIAKGAILGPGYGVKNYKIPKIKRPVEEKEVIEEPAKIDNKNDSHPVGNSSTEKIKENYPKSALVNKSKAPEPKTNEKDKKKKLNIGSKLNSTTDIKKSNRSKKLEAEKEKEVQVKHIPKSRRIRQAFIDSDSDTEPEIKQNEKVTSSSIANVKDSDKIENINSNTSFGIDDLEIFTDNMASDPVMPNINELIADLDNDIDTSKNDADDLDFTKDISFTTMLDKLQSPTISKQVGDSLDDISELIKEDMKTTDVKSQTRIEIESNLIEETKSEQTESNAQVSDQEHKPKNTSQKAEHKQEDTAQKLESEPENTVQKPFILTETSTIPKSGDSESAEIKTKESKDEKPSAKESTNNNEAIVSTTDKNEDFVKLLDEADDRCSTPDSTINNEMPLNKSFDELGLPDSTIEKNDMNSDVTSTHDLPEVPESKEEDNSTRTEIASLESIGSLLSILKDKSKMQELLGMLGDKSNENEKIKKALEKISEIVSDDDNTNTELKTEVVPTLEASEIDAKKDLTNDLITLSKSSENTLFCDKTQIESSVSIVNVPLGNKELKEDMESETNPKLIEKKRINKIKKKYSGKKYKKRKGKIQPKVSREEKRVTRSGAVILPKKTPKKASRELKQLHESIKEMFIKEDILNATGIRMCRLAKMVGDKNSNQDESNVLIAEPKPVVVLEKFKDKEVSLEAPKIRKKPGPKPKSKPTESLEVKNTKSLEVKKGKPGPKSKTKINKEDSDISIHSFEGSTTSETTLQSSLQDSSTSDSESESLASSKSYESNEVLADIRKKTKRKRRPGWQSGIIKKRKRPESKLTEQAVEDIVPPRKEIIVPDMNCFTDKTYCFQKNVSAYDCRLCAHTSNEIVKHYKTEHPHTEIPLSRMSETVAREAVLQCEDINFQAITKMITDKYICRFCNEEFGGKRNTAEEFFWHVVSTHTGEYKQLCSECINVTKCPFNLDIPPPPKEVKAQLIGYVCGKCNFTQISLENLKTHVIVRHNDEQTAVYTVNLSASSKRAQKSSSKPCEAPDKTEARILRSSRTIDSSECSDRSDTIEKSGLETNCEADFEKNKLKVLDPKVTVHSKLTFENDDSAVEILSTDTSTVKTEKEEQSSNELPPRGSSDIVDIPHFKVSYNDAGTKEYICCINGDQHYRTALLISMKKHVQLKHNEIWDGYCFICKVIVMPQGTHLFKECFQHCLDKHMDDFPVFKETENNEIIGLNESVVDPTLSKSVASPNRENPSSSNYINVRPISDLLAKETTSDKNLDNVFPKIQSVVSLGAASEEIPQPSPSYSPQLESCIDTVPTIKSTSSALQSIPNLQQPYKYEEAVAEVMSKKHRVILDTMLGHDKLVHIFKCAGAYCSFSTDRAEAAILHASAHQRVGGENSLRCAYCDYDCQNNAIDLVMHVFKTHGCCQFVCGHCFYRAVASQLVSFHIGKVHPKAPSTILQTATVSPITDDSSENMLPREIAVQQYVCTNLENQCKFKTYTHEKFMAHLTSHSAAYFLCHICLAASQSVLELMEHLKCHGYRLYQCTWCIDGGDNELEFLAHAVAKHPSKEPQAYLRLTRNNKILPLAKLGSKVVDTVVITPSESSGDPAKMAENSLDLEKIIRWTSAPTNESGKTPKQNETSSTSLAEITPISQVVETVTQTTEPSTPSKEQEEVELPLNPVLKVEPSDTNKGESNSEIICLDSDEETPQEPKQNVIDLSEDDTPVTPSGPVIQVQFYQCSKCLVKFKISPGFKKHLTVCYQGLNKMDCAHCDYSADSVHGLYAHYTLKHGKKMKCTLCDFEADNLQDLVDHQASKHGVQDVFKNPRKGMPVMCDICGKKDVTMTVIKEHIRKEHGFSQFLVSGKSIQNEQLQTEKYLCVQGVGYQKSKSKRKLSGSSTESATKNSPKRPRFGPKDLDKLPKKPILDELTFCSECEFNTKVRLNLVRHFQQHAEAQMVPQTAPVNPVPHLETNEKHFDKMINLASSSLETARQDKQVVVYIPPEAASRYPKYVPDRQRHTCGAKGCSYISLDESMLKYHWETLHAGSNDFHCVHCPPYQHLDTSKPLTSSRIVTHLKMHDTSLYACSSCSYYHFRKQVLEKHLSEVHKGSGQMLVVREESTNQSVTPQPANPTMDLKPWKCGLCAFKSMLLPEVVDHCSKRHSTKMQYKCPACPFRTSTLENVTKHKMKSHPGNTDDVFYYYYREGSISDEPDGTPRWEKQRQKLGITDSPSEVKTESETCMDQLATLTPILQTSPSVNLDIVKTEVVDPEIEETIPELCMRFGKNCNPNGLKYKCPLCKILMTDTKEDMRSHLYEELKYRKWGCSVCSYKGFHKAGLNDHMFVEHKQTRAIEPIELPVDKKVERWVAHVLEHQTSLIETNKANLAKQKIQVEKPKASTSATTIPDKPREITEISEHELEKLKETFGDFGSPSNLNFCCPKCDFQSFNEESMKDHLESELNKIRWRCSACNKYSTNYHEAQLHCKVCASRKIGKNPQPMPTARDPSIRARWLAEVISSQKRVMNKAPEPITENVTPSALENSLLVVRYEEQIATPEEEMLIRRKRPAPSEPAPEHDASPDSDDERLVIDEIAEKSEIPNTKDKRQCAHCNFSTKYSKALLVHEMRHYNLKPYTCGYCEMTFYSYMLESHSMSFHPDQPPRFYKTTLPSGPPLIKEFPKRRGKLLSADSSTGTTSKAEAKVDEPKMVCLICHKLVGDTTRHTHDDRQTYFGKKGDVVVKCCNCLELFPSEELMREHHGQTHPNTQINYAFHKLLYDKRGILHCGHCNKPFKFVRDLKTHHNVYHSSLQFKYESKLYVSGDYENEELGESANKEDVASAIAPAKRVARKSTTKLPSQAVARKSTTKLPFYYYDAGTEYSFYGTKPTPLRELESMTTMMSLGNTKVPVTLKQLSNVMKIDPVVIMKDCQK